MPLTGWTNGILTTTTSPCFTSFPGRYRSSEFPVKMYTGISTTASILRLEFDFYEIDSWGNDAFAVFINCFTIQLGLFNVDKYQGMLGGFVEDVHFETNSLGSPTDLGFGGFDDQRHNVTINLPSRFFNGLLQVQFGSNLDRVIDNKSYGIDNIKITAYQC